MTMCDEYGGESTPGHRRGHRRRIRQLSDGHSRRDLEIVANDAARTALRGAVAADDGQPIRQVHIGAALDETTATAERGGDA